MSSLRCTHANLILFKIGKDKDREGSDHRNLMEIAEPGSI